MDEEQTNVPQSPLRGSPRVSAAKSEDINVAEPSDTFIEKPLMIQESPKIPSPVISPVPQSPPLTFTSSPKKESLDASIKSQRSIMKELSQDIEKRSRQGSDTLSKNNKVIEPTKRRSSATEQINGRSSSIKGSINTSIRSPRSQVTDKNSNNSEGSIQKSDVSNLNTEKSDFEDHSEGGETDLKQDGKHSPVLYTNINKIADMSRHLTNEANALRNSIRTLSEDIVRTKKELSISKDENVNFPYHLFLIELIVNKIHMKCDCFEFSYNNLVIAASFLGKQPIVLYDSSYGKIDDFNHLNVGKSALFAMTYDKICSIQEFVIHLNLTKQPPCSSCVMKVAEAKIDCTKEFLNLRDELCKKWTEEQPKDNIMCTTSTPLNKNMCYLRNGDSDNCDSIGVMEVTVRMSFLGKEITTAFSASTKPKCTSVLNKEDNGMSMYTCHDVEMDGQGKILLDEDTLTRKEILRSTHTMSSRRTGSPVSQLSAGRASAKQFLDTQNYTNPYRQDYGPNYNEIFTKMNENELRIRVPKTTKLDRTARYDRIQELCSCETTPYNTGDQIQLELPKDNVYSNEYAHETNTSHVKYAYKSYDRNLDNRNRKIINVTPPNCNIPVNMEKQVHPRKDVFILKIGKKLETKDKKTDLEIELVTPKAPVEKAVNNNDISQQCSCNDMNHKPLRKEIKEPTKKGKKTGLGEFRIRDLNDEINKLMREKRHWEVQIKSLGGPDHARVGPRMLDQDGKEVPGNRGYKYFGAAKDLPGVRELFEQEPPAAPRRTRADLMRDVDADYYGYRDDEDGLLLPLEREAEIDAIARAVDEWKRNKDETKDQDIPEEENIYPEDPEDKRIIDEDEDGKPSVTSHVAVPSQKDVEEALLKRKKQELLERYGCLDVKMEGS
ncbi:unnamed protein product [Danaus chrysippus]|uniref:(African queen) hypothetical protein n=1 Tax=Danaus chrysippus TaxID=151541 RepID=A0A8J2QGT7_9NEOP|nr:unnamed protein product [Danaus chrysippus]